jgi:tetraacyldisaccharide 4'-kinase
MERLWFGDDVWARTGRLVLAPFEGIYGAVVRARGMLYDAGVLRALPTAVPAISVGNLSVGGTGKTPVAAWLASELAARGAHPAIVLRGYGEDEPLVHRVINPGVPVVVAPDRVDGSVRARAAGADVVVLDDAFQHRHARRAADVVLLSADRWTAAPHLLPAGPYREPMRALRRASLIIITRKAEDLSASEMASAEALRAAPLVPQAWVRLAPDALLSIDEAGRQPLTALDGRDVHVLAAIGDPGAFVRQLEQLGARVTATIYPDHHHFSDDEIASFARRMTAGAVAVCTLKDAVKVRGRWPREAPTLWYVSQHVIVERGWERVEQALATVLDARAPLSQPAG